MENHAGARTYAGLFMVTLATLMEEILLTRIFSVTMWYHFVFLAISVAMFGLTLGGLLVYLAPHYFTGAQVEKHHSAAALGFAVTTGVSFLVYLAIPPIFYMTVTGVLSLLTILGVISVPFIFSGVAVCLALTKFPRQVSQLYAADLSGAADASWLFTACVSSTPPPR